MFVVRAYVCSPLELPRKLKISLVSRSRLGLVITPWSWDSTSTFSTSLTLYCSAGIDLSFIGVRCCGRHLDCFLYVLVSLSQEDWVRQARAYFFLFPPQIWLSFLRRTDSTIMTLISYSISSGVVTWWDLKLRQSDTLTNPSSLLTIGVLITVRGYPHSLPFRLVLSRD